MPRTSRVSILDDETPAPPPNPEPPLTSNYDVASVSLVRGLNQPIRFVFSPVNPSQVYVAEKPGVIALSDLTTGTTRTLLDLSGALGEQDDATLSELSTDIVKPHRVGPGGQGLLDDAGHVAAAYGTDALILVRPDGYIGLVADPAHPQSVAEYLRSL